MKRKIVSAEDLKSYIDGIAVSAPIQVQNMLRGNLLLLNSVQYPPIVDTALSEIIDSLYQVLRNCEDEQQKEQIRCVYSSIISNLILFLDIKLRCTIEENRGLAEELFLQAGDLFMDNIKNTLLLAVNIFGTGAKVCASAVGNAGKDFMIIVNEAVTDTLGGAAGKKTTFTANTDSIMIEREPSSDESVKHIFDFGKHNSKFFENSNFSKESTQILNQWEEKTENVIVQNIFSPENRHKSSKLVKTFFQYINKPSDEQRLWVDFFETIFNTIDKLDKYFDIIGPSIIISDMIDRYVRLIEKTIEDDKLSTRIFRAIKEKRKKHNPSVGSIIPLDGLALGDSYLPSVTLAAGAADLGLPVANFIVALASSNFAKKSKYHGEEPTIMLERYKGLALKYRPDLSKFR